MTGYRIVGGAFDAILWLCIWAVFTGHALAGYADNYILFFAGLIAVIGILMSVSGKRVMLEKAKEEPEYLDESSFVKLYYDASPVAEALAIAVIGHWLAAIFYLTGALFARGTKAEARKEFAELTKGDQ